MEPAAMTRIGRRDRPHIHSVAPPRREIRIVDDL
jgi:hypothetical protein